jgi:hypothetical protein
MTERRYSQEEVNAIFQRASETEAALPAGAGNGLTLAALQDIAREVGISPQSISLAAQSLDHTATPPSATFLGLPIGVSRVVEFGGKITDADWELLVADMRTTFNAKGVLRYDGPFRQWTNGNLRALVEPTPGGSRLRLQTMNGNARTRMMGGLAIFGVGTATLIASSLPSAVNAGASGGVAVMALVGLGLFASGAYTLRGWARRRAAQFEEIIARVVKAAA